MLHRTSRLRATVLAMAAALAAGACDDDPTSPGDDHHEPAGVRITMGGVTLVTAMGNTVTGALTVAAGEETAHMSVVFLDDEGDPITTDDDEFLEVVIGNEAIAEFEQDTPGEFGGHLHGVMAGSTTAIFRLMHGTIGGTSHADYISPAIPVQITD
jgi:hypothetical protein